MTEFSDRERFESIMQLSGVNHARWQTKNATEWKVAFATWAVLIASPLYVSSRPSELIVIALLATVVLIYSVWAFLISRKNHYDVAISFHYLRIAESMLGTENQAFAAGPSWDDVKKAEKDAKYNKKRFTKSVVSSPAFWFQLIVTIVIAIAAYSLIGRLELNG